MVLNNGALALEEKDTGKYGEILSYLSEDSGYWIENDVWEVQNKAFTDNGLFPYLRKTAAKIDFSPYVDETIRNEVKYYLLSSLKKGDLNLGSVLNTYSMPIKRLGEYLSASGIYGIKELKKNGRFIRYLDQHYPRRKGCRKNWIHYLASKNGFVEFIHNFMMSGMKWKRMCGMLQRFGELRYPPVTGGEGAPYPLRIFQSITGRW